MKPLYVILFVMFAVFGLTAFAPDSFLMPESFYVKKGDKLNIHLISGDDFSQQEEGKYIAAKTAKFSLYEGSKKIDLTTFTKESALPVLNYTLANSGLLMVEMNTKDETNELPREDFVTYLTKQGYDTFADKLKDDNRINITEKYRYYLKTLISVDNPGGNAYDKVLGSDLEIILKQNPYKKSYGDDISAQVNYKGKPLKDSPVYLYIRTTSGNVYPQKLQTDANGQFFFSPSRDGIYMIRCVRIEELKNSDADFETWCATYSFAFSNRDDNAPNTYREFGFGNKH